MYLLRMFHLLWAVLFTVEVNGADVNCASFQSTSTSVTWNNTYTVTLKFAINNECPEDQGPVHSVRLQKGLKGATVCSIAIQNESCGTHVGCSCTTSDGHFILTKDVNTLDDNEWSLVGFLDQKGSFTEPVSLQTTTTRK
ncbi:hypothetical protein V1264_024208 [Littorina saxatilis]|uniref:Uncharacterized protein n=1 Tax=Littorina saxatilis TaxID=31220 RepID=A0AAN9ALM3_9CAEN